MHDGNVDLQLVSRRALFAARGTNLKTPPNPSFSHFSPKKIEIQNLCNVVVDALQVHPPDVPVEAGGREDGQAVRAGALGGVVGWNKKNKRCVVNHINHAVTKLPSRKCLFKLNLSATWSPQRGQSTGVSWKEKN